MNNLTSRVSRIAIACSFSAIALCAQPAAAQIVIDEPLANGSTIQIVTPVNDTNCVYSPWMFTDPTAPCAFDGSRTVSVLDSSRTNFNASVDRIATSYHVDFDGRLQLDGRPVVVAFPAEQPFWLDITEFYQSFTNLTQEIDVTGSYDGIFSQFVPVGSPAPAPVSEPAYLFSTSNVNFAVNSINAGFSGGLETDDGGEYEFAYETESPESIINGNSVALTGRFHGTSGSGAIQFGKIGGTATLLTTPQLTDYPAWAGGTNYALYSPFGLEYALTTQITTQLDENGLITPAIMVTDGIEMNGSKVTGLAAGTNATDAVNKAQLDSEAQARIAADVGLANGLANEAATRAQADTLLNQRIAAEEAARAQVAADLQSEANARAAADLALGTQINALGAQLDTLTGRVDTLETRVDKLDRKVAASTAIAVAMSGNSFLPNTKFNLTANVSTYDGAQAGAFQMGAMLSDNVAVNAGVATSFNKGGKTAGRVGFTVGW